MNDMAIGYLLATDAAVRDVRSALPDAPTLPDRSPAQSRARIAVAGWLRAVADRMTPSPAVPRAACKAAS